MNVYSMNVYPGSRVLFSKASIGREHGLFNIHEILLVEWRVSVCTTKTKRKIPDYYVQLLVFLNVQSQGLLSLMTLSLGFDCIYQINRHWHC